MNTALVLPTHTPKLLREAVAQAAAALRAGDVIGLPTETVYGLAANALDAEAVARIFAIKGRPSTNPIIVHVADTAMLAQCTRDWTPLAQTLAKAFWPGPLTLVLKKAPQIPTNVCAGGDTVGLRWPAHAVTQAVIKACGLPLAAPSANPANQLSPTNAAHVQQLLGDKIHLILDGGQCQVGIESTVVDATGPVARILRPGMIRAEQLAAWVPLENGRGSLGSPLEGQPALSPGQHPKHYAPKARLVLASWSSPAEFLQVLGPLQTEYRRIHVLAHRAVPQQVPGVRITIIPDDVEAYARALYAELHHCDELGADVILVEAVRPDPSWQGVADRLRRGAAS